MGKPVHPNAAKPGRPLGIVRLALRLAAAAEPGTVRDLAERTQVGFAAAHCTVKNMARQGELVVVGLREVPWRTTPVQVYGIGQQPREAVSKQVPSHRPAFELQQVLQRMWRQQEQNVGPATE